MVRHRYYQRSVFEVILPDANKLWPDALRRIDSLLEDDGLIETVAGALEKRWPQSRRRGRPGTPAEVALRMLILKHLYDWSYEELEREVRANLVYRAFARIGCEAVPDAKTLIKIAQVLGAEVIQALHQRVVKLAVEAGVVKGRRMRIDTTVVETNIHYPTDSSLMADGVRVLTRTVKWVQALVGEGRRGLRERLRSVGRRCFEIVALSRSPSLRAGLVKAYRRLMGSTRAVIRDAQRSLRRAAQRRSRLGDRARAALERLEQSLRRTIPLVERVIDQTRKRVLGGDTHVPNKVLSIFEPHTEAIRKGKVVKPTEFGKLVTIQEADNQIISAYGVHPTRPADATLWAPALDTHQALFGRVPQLAAADRGFSSAKNEQEAIDRGVKRVILPRAGPKSEQRSAYERSRWFRRGQRWRVGCEGKISVLKRRHGLERCRYRGTEGIARWVGLGVVACNLLTIAGRARQR